MPGYDDTKDVVLYSKKTTKRNSVYVRPGRFILIEAGEIHQPQISLSEEREMEKLVVKIKV